MFKMIIDIYLLLQIWRKKEGSEADFALEVWMKSWVLL